MFVKIIISLTLIGIVFAIPIEYHENQQHQTIREQEYENSYPPAEYNYNYSVHDEHTGDIKSHRESRKGDDVQGQYELIEADGYRREPTDYIEHQARRSPGHTGSGIGQNSEYNQYNQQTPTL